MTKIPNSVAVHKTYIMVVRNLFTVFSQWAILLRKSNGKPQCCFGAIILLGEYCCEVLLRQIVFTFGFAGISPKFNAKAIERRRTTLEGSIDFAKQNNW